ncbi:hypothetical protein [Neorhizobium galegae]|uniref:hypothetical protein n=1 Tax=Neorhizobium galegae TaxID=399 RepID=UPI001F2F0013|nr:hypothetical protein [Neorhizobium galegae]UIK03622.1 hypothetical protein LZK81_12930 [Neorhizobium galegae]
MKMPPIQIGSISASGIASSFVGDVGGIIIIEATADAVIQLPTPHPESNRHKQQNHQYAPSAKALHRRRFFQPHLAKALANSRLLSKVTEAIVDSYWQGVPPHRFRWGFAASRSDPETSEVLEEKVVSNGYVIITNGRCYVKPVQFIGKAHMIAVAWSKVETGNDRSSCRHFLDSRGTVTQTAYHR